MAHAVCDILAIFEPLCKSGFTPTSLCPHTRSFSWHSRRNPSMRRLLQNIKASKFDLESEWERGGRYFRLKGGAESAFVARGFLLQGFSSHTMPARPVRLGSDSALLFLRQPFRYWRSLATDATSGLWFRTVRTHEQTTFSHLLGQCVIASLRENPSISDREEGLLLSNPLGYYPRTC